MYQILFTKEAKSSIKKLPANTKKQIKQAVLTIAQNPDSGKSLTRELKGLWYYRTGDYRIIYEIHRNEILVLILTLGHRKEIYQKAKRKLK